MSTSRFSERLCSSGAEENLLLPLNELKSDKGEFTLDCRASYATTLGFKSLGESLQKAFSSSLWFKG